MPHAGAQHKPLQPLAEIPITPGRTAFFFACAGLLTFGLLSPIALVVSLLALLKKPDPFGLVAMLLSAAATIVLADVIFFGGVLMLMALRLVMG